MIKNEGGIWVLLVKIGIFAALLTPVIVDFDLYFPFVASKGLWFMACAQLAFFSWLVLAWHWRHYRPNFKNPVVAAVLAYLGVLFLSAILGADFSASFWSTFERMGGVLMFCHLAGFMISAALVLEARDWRNVFFASAAVALAVGLRALFDQSAAARGGGFLGNDSFLGTYLLFNVFIALYLFWSGKNAGAGRGAAVAGIVFAALAFCLLVQGTQLWAGIISGGFVLPEAGIIKDIFNSGARAAKISFLGGLVLLEGLRLVLLAKKTLLKKIGIIAVCLGIAAAAAVWGSFQNGGAGKQFFTDNFGESTVASRLAVWEIAWRGFFERPVFGWGPENFGLVFARHYNPCLGSSACGGATWYDRAHNIVFDTLAETGIAGLIAYLAVFAAALFVLWQNRRRQNGVPAAAVFPALFAAYFVQNLTVFDMPASHLMLFLCLGFAAANFDQGGQKPKTLSRPPDGRILAGVAVAATICFAAFVLSPWSAAAGVIGASREPFFSAAKLDLHQRALEASPLGIRQVRLFFARQWLNASEDKEFIEKAREGEIPMGEINRYFNFFTGELEKSGADCEFDFASRLELGRLYRQWSVFDRAKIPAAVEALESARSLSPRNQQPFWELAQMKLYENNVAGAEELARQAHDLYPENVQSRAIMEEIEKIRENRQ